MNVRTTLLVLAIPATLVLSQTAGSSQDTLRVDVQLVNVVATVTDPDGRYVSGLTAMTLSSKMRAYLRRSLTSHRTATYR